MQVTYKPKVKVPLQADGDKHTFIRGANPALTAFVTPLTVRAPPMMAILARYTATTVKLRSPYVHETWDIPTVVMGAIQTLLIRICNTRSFGVVFPANAFCKRPTSTWFNGAEMNAP